MIKWGEKNEIEFWTIPLQHGEAALDVLRNGFFEDEAFCNGLGVSEDEDGQEELLKLCLACIKDGISIMATDKLTGKIVGACFNKLQETPPVGQKGFFEEFRDSICKNKTAIDLINEMMWFDGLVDLYDKYKTDRSAEIMFLGTNKEYRRRGIANGLVDASLKVIQNLPSLQRPPIVTAIFTSPFSIKVGRNFQFEEIVQVPTQDKFKHPKIGPDHCTIVMVKRI